MIIKQKRYKKFYIPIRFHQQCRVITLCGKTKVSTNDTMLDTKSTATQ